MIITEGDAAAAHSLSPSLLRDHYTAPRFQLMTNPRSTPTPLYSTRWLATPGVMFTEHICDCEHMWVFRKTPSGANFIGSSSEVLPCMVAHIRCRIGL